YLDACIRSPPVAKMIKQLHAKPREFHAHQLPWLQYPFKTYGHNVMLVGDAAGFPCPLEAEGIWHAMYSGRLAALNAKDALDNDDVSEKQMKKYEAAWEDSPLGEEFSAGKEFQEFWAGLPFNTEKIGELNDFVNDTLNLFTGSTSHLEMSQLFIKNLREKGPSLFPLFRKYFFPYAARILEEEMSDFSPLTGMLEKMKPKKGHRRRN
ncbi:MAG: NAD(P)/FAD-dependent oxidoreductase, partial [Candidatus Helarchaeota archaeon]